MVYLYLYLTCVFWILNNWLKLDHIHHNKVYIDKSKEDNYPRESFTYIPTSVKINVSKIK
jgi:hypothetical protein